MKETTIITERPENEAVTINRMRCFGWEPVINQAVSPKCVKITFERDTDMVNFQYVDSLYQRFIPLLNEKIRLQNVVDDGGTVKMGVIAGLANLGISFAVGAVFSLITEGELDFMAMWFPMLISLFITTVASLIIGYSSAKKKNVPQINQLDNEMDQLAREAQRYI